ncbi:hypothetical protein DDSR119_66 [Pseudomonas phage DDSR119]|nr:hypothetical protein DDSR119_66 [Pseudomonas phage DDSR119]
MKRLYVEEKWTLRRLGEEFGLSYVTVRTRLEEIGVEFRETGRRVMITVENGNKWAAEVAKGRSKAAIAKREKVSESTVERAIRLASKEQKTQ